MPFFRPTMMYHSFSQHGFFPFHGFCLIPLICALLFISRVPAFCESPPASKDAIQEIRAENQDLQERLNHQRALLGRLQLKQKRAEQAIRRITEDLLDEREEKALANLFSSGGLDNMIFHGYVDLEWKSAAFDRAQGGKREHNFFDNHHFNLWFGYRISDNLIAKSEIEIEHAGEAFGLEFATLEWKPFSSDILELVMGKILVPLGIENPVHASVRNKLISRPLPSRSIIPGTYGDVGIEARGWYPSLSDPKFRYHFYIVNGLGDGDADQVYEQNALTGGRDNNGNKGIGTQLVVFPITGLEAGGSGYSGKWDDQDNNRTVILVAHVIYRADPLALRAEYVHQEIEAAKGPGKGDATLKGFYLQLAYKLAGLTDNALLDGLEVISRYDQITNEDGVDALKQGEIPAGEREQRLALGLIFRPQAQLQFKIEYMRRDNKGASDDRGLAFQAVANW